MLEWVVEVIIEFSVSIVMCLLDYSFLDNRDRPLFVIVQPICSFWAEVPRKWFRLERTRLYKGSVQTGLADEIVLDSKRRNSEVIITLVHSSIKVKLLYKVAKPNYCLL